jgi:hypothetical protein
MGTPSKHPAHLIARARPAALAAAEALGLAVSPSMAGPHEEETATMLNVFLKSNKYPANRAFIM